MAQNNFSVLIPFLKFNLKILSILFCWVSRCHLKAFFTRISNTGLNLDMWFFNFQNLVRSCQHIDGTPCKIVTAHPKRLSLFLGSLVPAFSSLLRCDINEAATLNYHYLFFFCLAKEKQNQQRRYDIIP